MKHFFWTILLLLIPHYGQAQYSGGGEANPGLLTNVESLQEFQDMRFGMFIHWGPVSLKGTEISWSRGREIPIDEYDKLYLGFNPELYAAADWVGAAKAAGMQYIIITSRHHDGFSLWDSEYTDYDMAATPYGKGILKELAEECEKQGIKFGTYYSICDWYRDDYPVDYPAPDYSFNESRNMDSVTQVQMEQYITFMKKQLEELVRDYNTFLIWFDGEWEWAWTHEMGTDMYAYLREMKDDILINNRVDKGREGMEDKSRSARFAGDFATPEQQIGAFDNKFAWETCMTIGEQWAWKPNENLKSKKECIHTLLQTIGGDGNLLFNVGPMPDGRIEQRQVDILTEIGQWLSINQEAVYGTRGGPYLPTEKMVSTHKENKIYIHLLSKPGKTLVLPHDENISVKSARFLQDDTSLNIKQDNGSIILQLPKKLPDEVATVIELTLDRPASEIDLIKL
ncbi:MAG: alpha-L-fucosidase [Bacteroidales bacterium]|nr:alpha-L-fucosidase [Bacteroidales bacterium]